MPVHSIKLLYSVQHVMVFSVGSYVHPSTLQVLYNIVLLAATVAERFLVWWFGLVVWLKGRRATGPYDDLSVETESRQTVWVARLKRKIYTAPDALVCAYTQRAAHNSSEVNLWF